MSDQFWIPLCALTATVLGGLWRISAQVSRISTLVEVLQGEVARLRGQINTDRA